MKRDIPIKKSDLALLAVVFTLAALLFALYKIWGGAAGEGSEAVITVNGGVVAELALDVDFVYEIETEYGVNTAEISGGQIRIIHADCPDKLCVRQGSVGQAGQVLVCLPNRVVIEIKGKRDAIGGLDGISR